MYVYGVNPRIFRENDVRGHAERDLDDATVTALGSVLGRRAASAAAAAGTAPLLVVGRDGRLHSPRLLAALCRGATTHCRVVDLGVVPTPVVSFASQRLASPGHAAVPVAVMITGSHNPAEENGFKITLQGASLHGGAVSALRDEVAAELAAETASALAAARAPAPQPRFEVEAMDLAEVYLETIVSSLRLGPRRFRVAVDAGNGAAGPLAVALLARLGFPAAPLYCDIDGRFPHHHPDPTVEENLRDLAALVTSSGAEVGIGFDGDGDRLGVLDEHRRIVWGDQLLVLFGRALLAEVPGARLVAEVKCSQATFDALTEAGGEVEMWKVGHSLLKARMKETGALLAGEMSGHFFFAHRWLGFDDGLYAAARLLELLSHDERHLAAHVDQLPPVFNTPELRVPCADDRKASVVATVAERLRHHPQVRSLVEIDGVRASFDGGWALLRASTTQPIVVMRYEADSERRLGEIQVLMDELVQPALGPSER